VAKAKRLRPDCHLLRKPNEGLVWAGSLPAYAIGFGALGIPNPQRPRKREHAQPAGQTLLGVSGKGKPRHHVEQCRGSPRQARATLLLAPRWRKAETVRVPKPEVGVLLSPAKGLPFAANRGASDGRAERAYLISRYLSLPRHASFVIATLCFGGLRGEKRESINADRRPD